jgi:integrase
VDIEEELEDLGMAWLTQNRRTLAPKTTSRRLTSLKEFAKWAGFPNYFDGYNTPTAGSPVPHPLIEGMEGVRRMIAATENERHKCLIALQGMCGLRVAEALEVKSAHLTFQGVKVTLKVFGKGERIRYVPVSDEAFEYLMRPYLRSINTDNTLVGLKDRFARRCITDLGVKAGISGRVSSHDLRATFATAVYNKTKDRVLVQRLLGHQDPRNTDIYIATEEDKMQEGVTDL